MPSKQIFFAKAFSGALGIIFVMAITVGLISVFHTNNASNAITLTENKVINALNSDPYNTNQWRTLSQLAFDQEKIALGMNARHFSDKLSNSAAQYNVSQYQDIAIAQ